MFAILFITFIPIFPIQRLKGMLECSSTQHLLRFRSSCRERVLGEDKYILQSMVSDDDDYARAFQVLSRLVVRRCDMQQFRPRVQRLRRTRQSTLGRGVQHRCLQIRGTRPRHWTDQRKHRRRSFREPSQEHDLFAITCLLVIERTRVFHFCAAFGNATERLSSASTSLAALCH